VNFPDFSIPHEPEDLSLEDLEYIAQQTRRHWGLGDGPISDVVLLLENNGAIVVCQELGAHTLDAFSEWNASTNTPYIVLGTDKKSAMRWRFNAAHELGHMVLHRRLRASRIRQKDTLDLIEEQANYFAGAFLMPASTFGAAIVHPSIQSFVAIKTQWRVSVAAMICRANNLGVISDTDAVRLHTYRSQRGWTKVEPYDDVLEPETPRFIERAFDLMLREGLTSKAGIESATAMYASDIESAVGLEAGFLGDDVQHYKFPQPVPADDWPTPPDNYTMSLF
jgi:Zn-dependent peptidase ImmA (M78 family)